MQTTSLDYVYVLLVDPEPSDYLQIFGADQPYAVRWRVHQNGEDVMASADLAGVDLCLINTQLPDVTGVELYHAINRRLGSVPVVLVADRYCREEELSVLDVGALHFVCKPITPSFVDKLVQQQLAKLAQQPPVLVGELNSIRSASPSSHSPIDELPPMTNISDLGVDQ